MPGWLPNGITLEGLLGQIHGGGNPSSPAHIRDTGHSQDFDTWLKGLPTGTMPWDWFTLGEWLRQNDPKMHTFFQAAQNMGPPGMIALFEMWSHNESFKATLQRYWEQKVKEQPIAHVDTGTGGKSGSDVQSGTQAADPVPMPFDKSHFWVGPGYSYGDEVPRSYYPSGVHEGQDYQTPTGTELKSPFTATVSKVGYDPDGYGNYIDLQFGNQGNFMRFAHLQYIGVKEGDHVTPGQSFGQSGHSGLSIGVNGGDGGHVLIELRNGRNQALDPRPLLEQIFKGTTFAKLTEFGVDQIGAYNPAATYETTPDGHQLWAGTPDRTLYDMVDSEYSKRYGTHAPWSVVMGMRHAGIVNTSQMKSIADNWPSDIPGVTFGTRDKISATVGSFAEKQWGRPVPDSVVKQLAREGKTTQEEIKLWFMDHMPNDIPKGEYQQVYDAAAPAITNAYKQGPSPAYINYLWEQSKTKPAGTNTVSPKKMGME
jgi:murein DD-endopeptidase MepM/ murein hydrolase activator NlpD